MMCRDRTGMVWRSGGRGRGAFVPITFAPEFGPDAESEADDNDGPAVPDLVDSSDGAEDLSWVD